MNIFKPLRTAFLIGTLAACNVRDDTPRDTYIGNLSGYGLTQLEVYYDSRGDVHMVRFSAEDYRAGENWRIEDVDVDDERRFDRAINADSLFQYWRGTEEFDDLERAVGYAMNARGSQLKLVDG